MMGATPKESQMASRSIQRKLVALRKTQSSSTGKVVELNPDSNADPDDVFFSKLLLNLLSQFSETYTEYSLIHRLAHETLLEGPWFVELRKLINDAMDNERSLMGVSLLRSFLGRSEVLSMVRQIYKVNPHLKAKPRVRETSATLADLLDLTEIETLLLDAGCRFPEMCYQTRALFDGLDMRYPNPAMMFSQMFKRPLKEAQRAKQGLLFNAGILTKDGCAPDGQWGLNSDLADVFINKNLKVEDIDKAIFPHMLTTDLTREDYPHLEKEITHCIDIIEKNQTGKKKREPGVNVMFWGVAGTGKTELAMAIAKERGWNLKVIGDISPDNMNENSRQSRLTSLKLASKIFRNQPNTVLLFDEMEDLFKHDTNAQFSKAFINRIIETTEIPIIWTTNHLRELGQPVLRRMVYNIGFKVPPEETREKMWEKYCTEYKLKVEAGAIKDVAKTYPVPPAVIRNAVHVTSTAFGRKKVTKPELFEIVGSLDTLVNYGQELAIKETEQDDGDTYDITCVNADQDMENFTNRLLNAKTHGFALCLYGAPGTGKSEYGRYLAKKMGKEILFKRASDLQSMWVGECEKNIAKAFAEAKKKGMILLIDEGDSFLRDREKARNSWEVSQVNEMLSQMERHPQPFILTTNLMKDLDAASLRRFTFKLKFDYMTTAQARRLFKGFFGMEAPSELDRNPMLVPGDYANVKKQVDILGITSADEIYRMLNEETKLKPGKRAGIGF
jgi:transitional endoplasmic reticulum ATPase